MKSVYRIAAILCPVLGILLGALISSLSNFSGGPTILSILLFYVSIRIAKHLWWLDYKSPNEVDYPKKE